MAFGTKAVILAEIGVSSLRQAHYDEDTNNDELRLSLDCLAKVRDEATLKDYNQRVKLIRFNPDDMVLRKVS